MRAKVDAEKEGLDELDEELHQLESERDSLRFEVSQLWKEIEGKKEYRTGTSNADLDMAIWNKL